MPFTRQDLRNQLKHKEIAPAYVVYGPETFLRDLAAKTIAERSFGDGDFRDFNDVRFRLGTGVSLQEAIAAAEQLPMMSTRRVVTVNEVRISAAAARDTIKEEHESLLSEYLAKPPDTSVLILVADEFNRSRKMAKLLEKHAYVVEFAPMSDAELASWVVARFGEAGVFADTATAMAIVARTGSDVRRVNNEVAKLATAALPDSVVTTQMIEDLVPMSRETDGFEFAGHILAGRSRETLTALRKTLDDGTEPLQVLGAVSYTFRRLLMTKDMMSRDVDRREIAAAIKGRYSEHEPLFAAARRAKTADLARAVKRIAETDVAIKTSLGGSNAGRLQLEILVCELALMTAA
jgi:DNA polymerase III subunit delta